MCSLPKFYAILPRVLTISILFCSFLSDNPSTIVRMNPFKLLLISFSGRETRINPARWTKTLTNCLFVSLIWAFTVLIKSPSWGPKLNLPPNYNWAVNSSAPSFLFCQLPLSFIIGKAFWTSTERSVGFPLCFGAYFFAVTVWLSTAASP